MTQVSMQQVKELRDRTQAGLNDCRSALLESDGNMDTAVDIILKKGLAKSAKRAGAVASEGLVVARVAPDNKSGVLVEVNIQTDFAARNEDFIGFVNCAVEAAVNAQDDADLGLEPYPGGEGTLEDNRKALVGKLGENITVRRWARLTSTPTGRVQSYVHLGGKIGVLLLVESDGNVAGATELASFMDDTAMQIAAMAPNYLRREEAPEAARLKQAEIFDAQLVEEGKPEAVRPKIVEGKINKWLKEICLLEQASVMQSDKSVDQLRNELSKTLGADVHFKSFVRYERGEGIEKVEAEDFATEVAKMAGN